MQFASTYFREFATRLETVYPQSESTAIISMLTEELLLLKKHQLDIVNRVLTPSETDSFQRILERLLKQEPVQHILGYTYFYGLRFRVNSSVLIPRPETEELVELILKDHVHAGPASPALRILDIGTGSGCIAISLKKNRPSADVFALDISEAALDTARENALQNRTPVTFFKADILHPAMHDQYTAFDIIVSNPPYIMPAEEAEMETGVKAFEPHGALFVTDNDPLQFYRAIAAMAKTTVREKLKLYLEINRAYGHEVIRLLQEQGFSDVVCLKDMHGNDRMVTAVLVGN